ncbi:transposase [Candidatus Dependentiae bacterium]|nr:transposase [Candidatus Dependentiae bacterium]
MINPIIQVVTDSGYQGIKKIHSNSKHPKKRSKKSPLTKQDKAQNREISQGRILNENVIGLIKRFKIISDRCRNRRKRLGFKMQFNSRHS